MTNAEYEAVREELKSKVGDADIDPPFKGDGQIVTSSWIPGPDWTGTPYEPIYHAASGNEILAGRVFGIILSRVIMEQQKPWGFGRYELLDGRRIEGMTYFRIELPPVSTAPTVQKLQAHFGQHRVG